MQEAFPLIADNSQDDKDHNVSKGKSVISTPAGRAHVITESAVAMQSDRSSVTIAQKAIRPSPNKKNFKKPDNSLLNFHFERPTPTTTYQSQSGVRNTTVSERRNKARVSLLSKESFLQAK